jgi:hypothetical protein
MPEYTTDVTVQTLKLHTAEWARNEATDVEGNPSVVETLTDGYVGNYAFRATFPNAESALRFEETMREHGCYVWRRMQPAAVRTWFGSRATVHVAALYSGGLLTRGRLEPMDDERIYVIPDGGDLRSADTVLIRDIVAIEPLPQLDAASPSPG